MDISIIITTSPIKSNPSTSVIDMALESIRKQEYLKNKQIFIVCDGVTVSDEKNAFKSGKITEENREKYIGFKQNLRKIEGPYIHIIERRKRFGFANNILFVMKEYVKSEFFNMILFY